MELLERNRNPGREYLGLRWFRTLAMERHDQTIDTL